MKRLPVSLLLAAALALVLSITTACGSGSTATCSEKTSVGGQNAPVTYVCRDSSGTVVKCPDDATAAKLPDCANRPEPTSAPTIAGPPPETPVPDPTAAPAPTPGDVDLTGICRIAFPFGGGSCAGPAYAYYKDGVEIAIPSSDCAKLATIPDCAPTARGKLPKPKFLGQHVKK